MAEDKKKENKETKNKETESRKKAIEAIVEFVSPEPEQRIGGEPRKPIEGQNYELTKNHRGDRLRKNHKGNRLKASINGERRKGGCV